MLRGQAAAVAVMLTECSTFGVEIRGDELYASPKVKPMPAICATCGRVTEFAEYRGCPRMRSIEDAMLLMLPAEILHAEPA